jgi:hypothetical protein
MTPDQLAEYFENRRISKARVANLERAVSILVGSLGTTPEQADKRRELLDEFCNGPFIKWQQVDAWVNSLGEVRLTQKSRPVRKAGAA